ncbi:hypothetical protein FV311_16265, partial [Escherichia coli]
GSGVKIAEGMKKTAPDGAVSGMPAIRETGPGKNLQAITVSTKSIAFQQHLFQPLAQLHGRGFQAVRSTRNRRDARAEFIF